MKLVKMEVLILGDDKEISQEFKDLFFQSMNLALNFYKSSLKTKTNQEKPILKSSYLEFDDIDFSKQNEKEIIEEVIAQFEDNNQKLEILNQAFNTEKDLENIDLENQIKLLQAKINNQEKNGKAS